MLEDAPVLNAGRGACRPRSGTYELDAAVMEGETSRAGAVAAVRGVRHPMALARAVLDGTPDVIRRGRRRPRLAEEPGLEIVGRLVRHRPA